MSTLTITITIALPDGVDVRVSGAAPRAPQSDAEAVAQWNEAQAIQSRTTVNDEPPWPDMTTAAAEAFPDAVLTPNPPAAVLHDTPGDWPTGRCPRHDRTWLSGTRGLYCPAKADSPPMNAKGYCTIVPGQIWNGRRIPGAP